ncbi:hypothetical protein [Methanoculleus chikugoensis]|uniref:hypothetical protein n=1 Tax=Methanoculleus chikugoensis TaxID=118126 RepID=UPI001FB307C7|nr:hypothetical protein [Methanoculleus chikugoensis]
MGPMAGRRMGRCVLPPQPPAEAALPERRARSPARHRCSSRFTASGEAESHTGAAVAAASAADAGAGGEQQKTFFFGPDGLSQEENEAVLPGVQEDG